MESGNRTTVFGHRYNELTHRWSGRSGTSVCCNRIPEGDIGSERDNITTLGGSYEEIPVNNIYLSPVPLHCRQRLQHRGIAWGFFNNANRGDSIASRLRLEATSSGLSVTHWSSRTQTFTRGPKSSFAATLKITISFSPEVGSPEDLHGMRFWVEPDQRGWVHWEVAT